MEYDRETLEYTLRRLAALVVQDPAYVPLFVRIEKEIEALTATQDAVERARAIVERYANDVESSQRRKLIS